MIAPPG